MSIGICINVCNKLFMNAFWAIFYNISNFLSSNLE